MNCIRTADSAMAGCMHQLPGQWQLVQLDATGCNSHAQAARPPCVRPQISMHVLQAEVIEAGTADALIVWWKLHLDAAHRFNLSTAPAWVAADTAPVCTSHSAASDPSTNVKRPADHQADSSGHMHKHAQSASLPGSSRLLASSINWEEDRPGVVAADAAAVQTVQTGSSEGNSYATRDELLSNHCREGSGQREGAECLAGRHAVGACEQEWRDHWKTCWAPIAGPAAGATVSPGQTLLLHASHDDTSIFVGAEFQPGQPCHTTQGAISMPKSRDAGREAGSVAPQLRPQLRPGAREQQAHAPGNISADMLRGACPSRAWVLRQQSHWDAMACGIAHAAEGLGPDVTCLVLGDSPQLALIAARSPNIAAVISVLVSSHICAACPAHMPL